VVGVVVEIIGGRGDFGTGGDIRGWRRIRWIDWGFIRPLQGRGQDRDGVPRVSAYGLTRGYHYSSPMGLWKFTVFISVGTAHPTWLMKQSSGRCPGLWYVGLSGRYDAA